MRKSLTTKTKLITAVLAIAFIVTCLSACETMSATQKGAVGGAAVGALGGQIIGGNTKGTLIGAGVGALGGALLNDHYDRKQKSAYDQGRADAQR